MNITTENEVIAAALDVLARRVSEADGDPVASSEAAGRYCQLHLGDKDREHFGAMFLDCRHRVIAWEILFSGDLDGAEVHPRVLARAALLHNASAVIIAHNHPSGNSEPSAADRAVTERVKQALALLDVRLLDHFVCTAKGAPVSLAARGWV